MLGILILHWKHPVLTQACLNSVLAATARCTDPPLILVVDNGSLPALCLDPVLPDSDRIIVHILRLPANLGYAGGNNIGIRKLQEYGADDILVLNNDTVLDRDALYQLEKARQAGDGLLVPKIYLGNRQVIWAAGVMERHFPPGSFKVIGNGNRDQVAFNQARLIDGATGCALLITREALAQVGLFDEAYWAYWEDFDYSERVRNNGLKIRYVPQAQLEHYESMSLGKGSPSRSYLLARNMVYFFRKHKRSNLYLALNLGWVIVRELLTNGPRSSLAYIRGASAGLHGASGPPDFKSRGSESQPPKRDS